MQLAVKELNFCTELSAQEITKLLPQGVPEEQHLHEPPWQQLLRHDGSSTEFRGLHKVATHVQETSYISCFPYQHAGAPAVDLM